MKSTQVQDLENQVMAMMGMLEPRPEIAAEFSAVVPRVWDSQQGDCEKRANKLTARLEEQKQLKSELLRAKLRDEVCQSDDEEGNTEFSREIREIERQLRTFDAATADRNGFLRFCELAIADIPSVWRVANEDQRRRVLNLLLPNGILVGADRKISNPQKCSLFNMLAGMMSKKPGFLRMAAP